MLEKLALAEKASQAAHVFIFTKILSLAPDHNEQRSHVAEVFEPTNTGVSRIRLQTDFSGKGYDQNRSKKKCISGRISGIPQVPPVETTKKDFGSFVLEYEIFSRLQRPDRSETRGEPSVFFRDFYR